MSQKLLLVNSKISATNVLQNACLPNVAFLLYDYNNDTFESLLQKIRDLGFSSFDEVGFIFHGAESICIFKLLYSQKNASVIVNNKPPDISDNIINDMSYNMTPSNMTYDVSNNTTSNNILETWGEITDFLSSLKSIYAINTIDFFACDFYNSGWKEILNEMEVYLDIHIRASTDTTGNMANGGNWVMESDNTNIQSIYFNEKIAEYQFTFRTAPTNFKIIYNSVETDLVDVFDSEHGAVSRVTGYTADGTDLGVIFRGGYTDSSGYNNRGTLTTGYKDKDGIDLSVYFIRSLFATNANYSFTYSTQYNRIITLTGPVSQNAVSTYYFSFSKTIYNAQFLLVGGGGQGGRGGPRSWGGGGGGGGGELLLELLILKEVKFII